MNFDISKLFPPGELSALAILTLVGLLGVLAHWYKIWQKDKVKTSLWNYLFRDNMQQTIASVMTFNGLLYGAWLGGQLDGIPERALVVMAFSMGYLLDSTINKSTPTPEEAAPAVANAADEKPAT